MRFESAARLRQHPISTGGLGVELEEIFWGMGEAWGHATRLRTVSRPKKSCNINLLRRNQQPFLFYKTFFPIKTLMLDNRPLMWHYGV